MAADAIPHITEKLSRAVGENSGLNATVKFDLKGEGFVYIDGKSAPNKVTNEDKQADTTIALTSETALKLMKGEMNATLAFMQGKLTVSGDMGVAMKLGSLLQKAGAS